jgi:hypothetical protein
MDQQKTDSSVGVKKCFRHNLKGEHPYYRSHAFVITWDILLLCSLVIFSELCNTARVVTQEYLYSFMVCKNRLPR